MDEAALHGSELRARRQEPDAERPAVMRDIAQRGSNERLEAHFLAANEIAIEKAVDRLPAADQRQEALVTGKGKRGAGLCVEIHDEDGIRPPAGLGSEVVRARGKRLGKAD